MVKPTEKIVKFDVLVADGFVLSEMASVVDCLRVANRLNPLIRFEWRYLSANGGPIGSGAMAFVNTAPHDPRSDADYAVVVGNSYPDTPALSLGPVIASYVARSTRVILLAEAASRYIRDFGEGQEGLTTHWENVEFMSERRAGLQTSRALVSDTGKVMTCAGMGATVDVMLSLVACHMTPALTQRVADVLLHESIRDFQSHQPVAGAGATATGDRVIDRCIELMKTHIEDPLPLREIAEQLGLTDRSMERRFKATLGTTPGSFYRELRLNRAVNLLLNTTLSIQEIGLACGFAGGFTGVFKRVFGIPPKELRKSRKPVHLMGPR